MKTRRTIDLLDDMLSQAVQAGLLQRTLQDEVLDGRLVTVDGRALVNFGSCSYLGLEVDQRLKSGAHEAIDRYGTQFSSSRAYLSAPPYTELEALLRTIFGAPTLVAPTTTLAHLAALPVLVGPDDAVILDQQVHQSVQTVVNNLRVQGTDVALIRHNRMDDLEEKIRALAGDHRKIWYLADGVYSMYGDMAPLPALASLLARYEQLHLYIDDAHGMSWTGTHGRGYVLDRFGHHERLYVAVSMAKAFGAGGGALIFPDEESLRRVRTCGGPMIFSGPLQPPVLGACVASARLHLSDEFAAIQAELASRNALCDRLLRAHGLPVLSAGETPIHFVGMGQPRVAFGMVKALMDEGLYTNVAIFPAVPMRRAGVRFTVTRHQSPADIERLVEAIAHHFPRVLKAEGSSYESVLAAFKLEPGVTAPGAAPLEDMVLTASVAPALRLEHHQTIEAVDRAEWDRLMAGRGAFDWEAMRCFEAGFGDPHSAPEDYWRFHYFIVREASGAPVLATCFTDTLWKDDMLADEAVSRRVEAQRERDPGFLVSRNLAMGAPFTEGDHLYLDRSKDWRGALGLLLEALAAEQDRSGIQGVMLRDLDATDEELAAFLQQRGFLRSAELESMVLPIDWHDDEGYMARLTHTARRHLHKKVLPFDGWYEVEVLGGAHRAPTAEELAHLRTLYLNVKARHLDINTFPLPPQFFEAVAASPQWEIWQLKLKPEHGGDPAAPPAVSMLVYRAAGQSMQMFVGLDYRFVESHGAYRQAMRETIARARHQGDRIVRLGVGVVFEKSRFGARADRRVVYYQAADHYPLEVLAQIKAEVGAGG